MSFCWLCFGGFFCWLCSSGFWLVMGVRFMGLAMLDGIAVGLAGGHGCHRRFGHRLWVSLSMWPWAMGRDYGAGFFFAWVAG